MHMLAYISLVGLALTVFSTITMYVIVLRMIRIINLNPGPEGYIPLWSMLTRTAYLYHPIQRYRGRSGRDALYRLLQVCWFVFAFGVASVISGSIAEHFSHS